MSTKNFLYVMIVLIYFLSTVASQQNNENSRFKRSSVDESTSAIPEEESNITSVVNMSDIQNASNVNQDVDWNAEQNRSIYQVSFAISTTTEAHNFSYLDPDFIECLKTRVEQGEYHKFPNDSVHVPVYNKVFDKANHYIDSDEILHICPSFFGRQDKFSTSIGVVSLICVSISSICIIFHIVTFILVKGLRNLPGFCLMSLCVSLLCAYICTFIQQAFKDEDCQIMGMFLFYFFLASFFAMNTMSYDVWRSIRMATTQFRLAAERSITVRFSLYSTYTWGMPLVIVIATIIVHYTSTYDKYRLIFLRHVCWFAYKQALTLYFAVPLFTLLGINVIFFISSFYMISRASMSNSMSGPENKSDLQSRLFLSLKLASAMGFMWIFGLIAAAAEQEWMWYLYAICNALQGVFIFLSFTVSGRVRKAFMKAASERKSSSNPTQMSSQHATAV